MDGTLSVDPTISGGGGTVMSTSSGLTIAGTVAQIDADLSTLTYTAGSTVGRYEVTVSAADGPVTTNTQFVGEVDTVASPTLTALASFDGPLGAGPQSALIADADGNLFGTTLNGGANGAPDGDGTVFELTRTSTGYNDAPTVLASFGGADGQTPVAGLVADASGNLFGVTSSGGDSGNGSIFEIAKTTAGYDSAPTTLASFDGTDGAFANGTLIIDSDGDLFDATADGSGYGTVVELKNTNGYDTTPTVLATFDSSTGYGPDGNLVADSQGNLFGVTQNGGTGSAGTIFEIIKDSATTTGYDSTPVALASFSGADGANPAAGLIIDADGNLFGTTTSGGSGLAGDDMTSGGTVFELRHTGGGYDTAPTVLANLDATTGTLPIGGLIMDAAGNLFGTAANDGANDAGTIFEIAKASLGYDAPTVVVSLDAASGSGPFASLLADQAGNLFGTAFAGGSNGDGTVFEVADSGFQTNPACYCRGTAILTDRGEVAVEDLDIGDRLVTLSGKSRPIKWIGTRSYAGRFANTNPHVLPVCFAAGSLGANIPHRDLWVSPKHAVFIDGVLIPAEHLVNGVSVTRPTSVDLVAYFHIELDSHDVIVAEGAHAETFVDDDSRAMFHNASDFAALYPDADPVAAMYCAPRVEDGFALEAARWGIAERAGSAKTVAAS